MIRRPYRVRLRQLPAGNWAIDLKRWPWSLWREEREFTDRTTDEAEARKRAAAIAWPRVIEITTLDIISEP